MLVFVVYLGTTSNSGSSRRSAGADGVHLQIEGGGLHQLLFLTGEFGKVSDMRKLMSVPIAHVTKRRRPSRNLQKLAD